MNCNLITINFIIDSAYFEEHSVCVDMPSNRVWTYYKNYAEKKKFSGENSEKCVSYAVNTKQLDEVEHDIMNYQNRGLCYLPKLKAKADNTDTRF